MPSSGADLTSPFVAANVAFTPAGFTGTITDDFASVPWCDNDFGNYSDPATDHLDQIHTPANIARGIGDICRYIDTVDGVKWRMPTAKDWAELYGSAEQNKGQAVKLPSSGGWIEGNYYPLAGRAMGPGRNDVSIVGDGVATRVINANPNTDGALFLPTGGSREATNGAIYRIGDGGYYWSSTASTTANGYNMQFTSSNVWPQYSSGRAWALSIRCIRE